MAEFELAIGRVLQNEGGFEDDPADPGGITNYGMTLGAVREVHPDAGPDYIRALTRDEAVDLYRQLFWDRYGYGRIEDQTVAGKLFDTAVNMGAARAHKILQAALVLLSFPVDVDGVLGPASIDATNRANPASLLEQLKQGCLRHYRNIIAANPKLKKFENGWRTRALLA